MDRSDEVHVNLFLSWSYLQSFSATLQHDMCTKLEHYIHNHNNLKNKESKMSCVMAVCESGRLRAEHHGHPRFETMSCYMHGDYTGRYSKS